MNIDREKNSRRKKDTWIMTSCIVCGKEFETRKYYIRRGQMKTCSIECRAIYKRKDGFEYKGVWYSINAQGYYDNARKRKIYHRVIWEEQNGTIPDGHIIHHKNENKLDNHMENLELIEWGEHTRLHNLERSS